MTTCMSGSSDLFFPTGARSPFAMLCMALVAASSTACLYLIKPVFDDLIVKKNKEMLNLLCMAVLVIFGVKGASLCGNAYLMSYVSQRIITKLREDVYNHIQCLPVPYLDKMKTGNLMSRIINDVGAVQNTLSEAVTGVIKEMFSTIGCVGIMFYMDWRLAFWSDFLSCRWHFCRFSKSERCCEKQAPNLSKPWPTSAS